MWYGIEVGFRRRGGEKRAERKFRLDLAGSPALEDSTVNKIDKVTKVASESS